MCDLAWLILPVAVVALRIFSFPNGNISNVISPSFLHKCLDFRVIWPLLPPL